MYIHSRLVAAATILCCLLTRGQSPSRQGVRAYSTQITGAVLDNATDAPLSSVRVELSEWVPNSSTTNNNKSVETDPNGSFVLRSVPPGKYSVIATREGYASASRSITITSEDVSIRLSWAN